MKVKKNPDFQKLLDQQEWEKNKRFLVRTSILTAVLLGLIFFAWLIWSLDLRSSTKKFAEPVLDAAFALDTLEGDDISKWKDSIPVLKDFGTYLYAGIGVTTEIAKNPGYYVKKGVEVIDDVLSGRGITPPDTVWDTIYVEYTEYVQEVQVEEPEAFVKEDTPSTKKKKKEQKKNTVRVKIRQGEWSADRVRTKLKKAGKYTKTAEQWIDFIEEYKDEAVWHEKEYGVPAETKMAQALLESNAGKSHLARIFKNFFGKKCRCKVKKNKDGEVISRTFSHTAFADSCRQRKDDHWYDQFEFYSSVSDSWDAHSHLLKGSNGKGQYVDLFQYDDPTKVYPIPADWQKHLNGKKQGSRTELWAAGLKANGYATAANYGPLLVEIANTYDLGLLPRL